MKRTETERLCSIYEKIEDFTPLRIISGRIFKRYRPFYPKNSRKLLSVTVSDMIKNFLVLLCTFIIVGLAIPRMMTLVMGGVFVSDSTSLVMLTSGVVSYTLMSHFQENRITACEQKFLNDFEHFLVLFKHYFVTYNSVTDALYTLCSLSGNMLRPHAKEMYVCLEARDREEKVKNYESEGYHKYLRLFMSLISNASENIDNQQNISQRDAFCKSLMVMRERISADKRMLIQKRTMLFGRALISGMACMFVPYISAWGIRINPQMIRIYKGVIGHSISALIIVISILGYSVNTLIRDADRLPLPTYSFASLISKFPPIYMLVNVLLNFRGGKYRRKLKEEMRIHGEKTSPEALYTEKLICFCIGVVAAFILLTNGYKEYRNEIVYDQNSIDYELMEATSKQLNYVKKNLALEIDSYLQTGKEPGENYPSELMAKYHWITDSVFAEAVAKVYGSRIEECRNSHFKGSDALIAVLFGMLLYWYPYLAMRFRWWFASSRKQDEVGQLQAIVFMMKDLPGISLLAILENMEHFAVVFKPHLQHCINEYGRNGAVALVNLIESAAFEPFGRLIDCFLMAANVGIQEAFSEIESDIVNFSEDEKIDKYQRLERERAISNIISLVPPVMVLSFLLIPFLIYTIPSISTYEAISLKY